MKFKFNRRRETQEMEYRLREPRVSPTREVSEMHTTKDQCLLWSVKQTLNKAE